MNKYVDEKIDINSLNEEDLETARKEARVLLDKIEVRLETAKRARHKYSSC